jgi:hypothetical protein
MPVLWSRFVQVGGLLMEAGSGRGFSHKILTVDALQVLPRSQALQLCQCPMHYDRCKRLYIHYRYKKLILLATQDKLSAAKCGRWLWRSTSSILEGPTSGKP